jgi:FkbM family methyltransferase
MLPMLGHFVGESVSHSQIGQEQWVLDVYGDTHQGYFVDVGGYDGISNSNTLLLEKVHRWSGLIIEPDPLIFPQLESNRCVTLKNIAALTSLNHKSVFLSGGELGGLVDYLQNDSHTETRNQLLEQGSIELVETKDLPGLLKDAAAPFLIEYLDIDTEGSELEILQEIDFNCWQFGLMTIEHAGVTEKREKIFDLLSRAGYQRVEAWFEDWYFCADNVAKLLGVEPEVAAERIELATQKAPVVKVKNLIGHGKKQLLAGSPEVALEYLLEACKPFYPNNTYAFKLAADSLVKLSDYDGMANLIALAAKTHGQKSSVVEKLRNLQIVSASVQI